MRRILDLRITRWELKLVYVISAWLVTGIPAWILFWLGANATFVNLLNVALSLTAVLFGARVFRGRGEPVKPERPWWQMTAWPKLSRRLGTLFTAFAMILVLNTTLEIAGVVQPAVSLDVAIINVIQLAALAYLYLNSAVRLSRRGATPPEQRSKQTAPTFKPQRLPLK